MWDTRKTDFDHQRLAKFMKNSGLLIPNFETTRYFVLNIIKSN